MGPVDAVKTCLRKFVTFSGRASRSEYWWFALAAGLASTLVSYVEMLTWQIGTGSTSRPTYLSTAFDIAVLLPTFGVFVRRFHDIGKSTLAAMAFLLVPFLVALLAFALAYLTAANSVVLNLLIIALLTWLIIAIWLLTRPSQPSSNPYGPNPHEVPQ